MKITERELSLGCKFEHLANKGEENAKIQIYKEHGIFHVRAWAFLNDGRKTSVAWDSFHNLKEALKRFQKLKRTWRESVLFGMAFNSVS